MSFIQAIVLGLIQGLTEFLPISSSGHLIFVPHLFGWPDQGVLFDVVLHMGTLGAVVVFYHRRLVSLVRSACSNQVEMRSERNLAWLIAFSVIPAGIAGYVIETNDRSAPVVGMSLIIWGIVLFAADQYSRVRASKGQMREMDTTTWKDMIIISIAQAVALIPGTSRSGITMSAGLFRGLSKSAAADISFLMSVPVLVIAGAVKILEAVGQGNVSVAPAVLLVGFITSFVSGICAISLLLRVIKKWSFTPFVLYRIVVGVCILLFLV